MKKNSRRSGFTLVEVVVGSIISFIVLSSAVALFLGVIGAWARGESMMDGDNDTRQIVRIASDELREAMWVSVDADGMGITYRRPRKDASGDFEIPVVWDGIDRRMELNGANLEIDDGGSVRTIGRNVLAVDPFRLGTHALDSKRYVEDPLNPTAAPPAYRIFEGPATGLVSEVTVTIVTGSRGGQAAESVRAKKRERVVLRNVPQLIK
ncbi:hypothetical protein CCB80_04030 [Armatimonadetes bacterium Uphvl-Ar1]|nr:hypothetical protein CCB80_04030 [Armatimonadetes bacterium Uphvl-Ar1]